MAGPVSRLFNRTLVKILEPHINQTVARIAGNPPARMMTTGKGETVANVESRRELLIRAAEERRASHSAGGPYMSKEEMKRLREKNLLRAKNWLREKNWMREENWLAATQNDRNAMEPYLAAARKAEEELCRKLPKNADVAENTLGNFCKIKFGYPKEKSKH